MQTWIINRSDIESIHELLVNQIVEKGNYQTVCYPQIYSVFSHLDITLN